MMVKKADIKHILGELPLTAELYWQIRQAGRPLSKSFSMRRTGKLLPEWVAQASNRRDLNRGVDSRRVLLFSTLRYWIEHAALLGVTLAGQGHRVSLAYLPYANWHAPLNRFDIRRNNAYAKSVLQPAAKLLDVVFVFGVALFFGYVVERTDSILGVSLSHGLTNIVLFLVAPFVA